MQKSSTNSFKINFKIVIVSGKKKLLLLLLQLKIWKNKKKNCGLLGSILALEVNLLRKCVKFVTHRGKVRKLENMSNIALNIINMLGRMRESLTNTLVNFVKNQVSTPLDVFITILRQDMVGCWIIRKKNTNLSMKTCQKVRIVHHFL